MELVGKIIKLDGCAGLGFLLQEGQEGELRPFTFDKLTGYRGESVRELKSMGFRKGSIVKFKMDDRNRISLIRSLTFKQ